MSEPTIDEMLKWFDSIIAVSDSNNSQEMRNAIRAILEQHRDSIPSELIMCSKCHTVMPDVCTFYCGDCDPAKTTQLEAIRAFVERVEERLPDYDTGRAADAMLKAYRQAVYDEIAAIEKETE